MPADFVSQTYSRIRDGGLEVFAEISVANDDLHVDLVRKDGTDLTRDEHYAVTYMLHRGRVVLFPSAKNVYEVRVR